MNAQRETPPALGTSEGLNKTVSPDDTPSPGDAQGRSPSRSLDPANGRVRPEALERARNHPIAELWQRLGYGEAPQGRNVPSPWRDETHPSVQVGGRLNIVTDYGSDERLDTIDLMRRHMGGDASFAEAVAAVLECPVADVMDTDGTRDAVERLASVRGWKADAMRRLGATAEGACVHFPMRGGGGETVGTRKRRGDNSLFVTRKGKSKAFTNKDGHGGVMSPWPMPPDGTVLILEGEADACAAVSAGWDAVCATPGPVSAGVAEALGAIVAGRDCVLCPDPDPAGEKWRARVSQVLHKAGCTVRVAAVPDGDLDDTLKAHPGEERAAVLRRLVAEAKAEAETEPADPANDSPRSRGGGNEQADALIRIGRRADLFHDRDKVGWASFEVEGHRETHAITSRTFRLWLRRQFYEAEGSAPTETAEESATWQLQAEALFSGGEHEVYLRTAFVDDRYYMDLCDDQWRAVEVTGDGWRVVDNPPVRFQRTPGMQALPVPVKGGDLRNLARFVNAEPDSDTFVLLVAYLVGALAPDGPYPILAVSGEQGSGKSTTCRVIRALVDPHKVDLRSMPRDMRNLHIACSKSRMCCFDNLSGLSNDMSDELCRIATGAGDSERALYTNDEELHFDLCLPLVVNGIGEVGHRSDFRDRCVDVRFKTNLEDAGLVRDERTFWSEFERARPAILGALIDAVAQSIRNVVSVQLEHAPRMADFAKWVVAAEPALPWKAGRFMEAYADARVSQAREALDNSELARAVISLVEGGAGEWNGTASALLETVTRIAGPEVGNKRSWPTKANALSAALKRLAPDLRRVARIEVETGIREAHTGRRILSLRKLGKSSSPSSPSSPEASNPLNPNRLQGDDQGDDRVTIPPSGDDPIVKGDDPVTMRGKRPSPCKSLSTNDLHWRVPDGDDGDDDLLTMRPECTDRLMRTGGAR